MNVRLLEPFVKQYGRLPAHIQKKVDRVVQYLAQDIRHPGAHAKKMTGEGDTWEARVDIHYRLTFGIEGDTIVLRAVGAHNILRKP